GEKPFPSTGARAPRTLGGRLQGEFPASGRRLAPAGGSLQPGWAVLVPVIAFSLKISCRYRSIPPAAVSTHRQHQVIDGPRRQHDAQRRQPGEKPVVVAAALAQPP